MYEDCETQVTTTEGNTKYFNLKVGLNQGSAISPLLFIIIMDVLASEIDTEPPWAMLFADNVVLWETSKAAVERVLDIYGENNSKDMDWESAEQKQHICHAMTMTTIPETMKKYNWGMVNWIQ